MLYYIRIHTCIRYQDPFCNSIHYRLQVSVRCFYLGSSQKEINDYIIIKHMQSIVFIAETAPWSEILKYFLYKHTQFIHYSLFLCIYLFIYSS